MRYKIDDDAGTSHTHYAPHRLCHQEGTGEIDIQHTMPIPLIHIEQRNAWLHGGMVDENVDMTEVILHLIDNILCGYFLGDIVNVRLRTSTLCENLINNFLDIDRRNIN